MSFNPDSSYITSVKLYIDGSIAQFTAENNIPLWNLGPLLQGLLMEQLDGDFADYLHSLPFNPYSQYLSKCEDKIIWTINILDHDIRENLITPLLEAKNCKIKKYNIPLTLGVISEASLPYRELVNLISAEDIPSRFSIQFITPTSFKSGGNYQILPDIRLIYQNALMRYGSIIDSDKEADAETVDYLTEHTRITRYHLHSCAFDISGIKIPSFVGTMTLSVKGASTLKGLAHMLFKFSEFGGMGIKTSMGMGGFKLL